MTDFTKWLRSAGYSEAAWNKLSKGQTDQLRAQHKRGAPPEDAAHFPGKAPASNKYAPGKKPSGQPSVGFGSIPPPTSEEQHIVDKELGKPNAKNRVKNTDVDFDAWRRLNGYSDHAWHQLNVGQRAEIQARYYQNVKAADVPRLKPQKGPGSSLGKAPKVAPGSGKPGGGSITPESIAGGAETLMASALSFDFIPTPFLPDSDDLAEAKVNGLMKEVVGRTIRPEEKEKIIAAYRTAEKQAYDSAVRNERLKQAMNAMGSSDITDAERALTIKYASETPELFSSPATTSKTVSDAMAKAKAEVAKNPSVAEMQKVSKESFTTYGGPDMEIDLHKAIGAMAPDEEFGMDFRGAMQGFMQAVAGRVSQGMFKP